MSNYKNEKDERYDKAYDTMKNQGKNVGRKVGRSLNKKAWSLGKKGAKKIGRLALKGGKKILMFIGKWLVSTLAGLSPVILIALGIIIIVAGFWNFIYDNEGEEQRYTEETNYYAEAGFSPTDEVTVKRFSTDNRTLRQFYKFFSDNSYYQVLVNDDGTLQDTNAEIKQPNIEEPIIDFYNREKHYYLNPDLLYSIDKILYEGAVHYPEQTTKALKHKVVNNKIVFDDLTEENGDDGYKFKDNTLSDEYNSQGKLTGDKVQGVWNYGLAPIYHYFESERYEIMEGFYIGKQVYNSDTNSVEYEKFDEDDKIPFEFEIDESREDIHVMKKATTMSGDIEWDYELEDKEKMKKEVYELDAGISGQSGLSPSINTEKSDSIWVYDRTHKEWETKTKKTVVYISNKALETKSFSTLIRKKIPSGGTLKNYTKRNSYEFGTFYDVEYRKKVLVDTQDLYKKREGAVYEIAPRMLNKTETDAKKEYFEQYMYNFETYIPEDVLSEMSFKDRLEEVSILSLNIGASAQSYNPNYREAKKYRNSIQKIASDMGLSDEDYDLNMIIALLAYDFSLGNSDDGTNSGFDELDDVEDIKDTYNLDFNGVTSVGYNFDKSVLDSTQTASYNNKTIVLNSQDRDNVEKTLKYTILKNAELKKKYDDDLKALLAYHVGDNYMTYFRNNYEEYDDEVEWLNWKTEVAKEYFNPKKHEFYQIYFLEDVLSFYNGAVDYNALVNADKDNWWEKAWASITDVFSGIKTTFSEDEKFRNLSRNLSGKDVQEILITEKAFRQKKRKSEVNILDEDSLWNSSYATNGFSDYILSYEQVLELIPQLGSYEEITYNGNKYRTSSPFGMRIHPEYHEYKMHTGIDVAIPGGVPLKAPYGSQVIERKDTGDKGYGKKITLKHNDGVITVYAHLKQFGDFYVGDAIDKGDILGYVGTTGTSTGNHLHFEAIVDGIRIDPFYVYYSQEKSR